MTQAYQEWKIALKKPRLLGFEKPSRLHKSKF